MSKKLKRGWKLIVNVRIHVHFYAGFDDVFWSCNAGFCSPTPSVSSPPILPPLAEQKPSLHRQNTLFTKDHSYKNFQPLCYISNAQILINLDSIKIRLDQQENWQGMKRANQTDNHTCIYSMIYITIAYMEQQLWKS